MSEYDFDVALSFAGEDRLYVEKVAKYLNALDIKVFYDRSEEVELWGKNLYLYLDDIYQRKSKYCVIFISKYYLEKSWTNHEIQSAFARAFVSKEEYILPAKFDDTELPGLRLTTGYIDLRTRTPEELGYLIAKKLGKADYLDATLAYLRYHLIDYIISVTDDMILFENKAENFCSEFPIRLLVDMFKLGELSRMFLDPSIIPW